MIGAFFLVPFLMIVAVSVAHQNPGGFYETGFELTHFKRMMRATYLDIALFSISLSAGVAVICLLIGFPFTYFVTRLKRRNQVSVWRRALRHLEKRPHPLPGCDCRCRRQAEILS